MKRSILFLLAILCLAGCAKRSDQSTTDENVEVTKIYNLVILDRSGSMTPLREVAVQGYNETLDVIRAAQQQYNLEQQNLVTLTLFNHLVTDVYDCDTVQNLPNLLMQDYRPDGMTAMFDAIGLSLTKLQRKLNKLKSATNTIATATKKTDGSNNLTTLYHKCRVSFITLQFTLSHFHTSL